MASKSTTSATGNGEQSLLVKAMALHRAGETEQAQHCYEKVLQINPRQADAWHLLGVMAAQAKNYSLADDYFAKAIAIAPDNSAIYSNRAIALKGLGKLSEAIACYDKAIELNPHYAEAYYNRGIALKSLGQLDAAIASYDQAITRNPNYTEALSNRGNALKALRQLDAAIASYHQAIRTNPHYVDAHYNLGIALKESNQLEAALASFNIALGLAPDLAEAHNNKGSTLQAMGRFEEALASYDKAIQSRPDHAEAHHNHGTALRGLLRNEEALESFNKAISIKPDYVEAYTQRGDTLLALQRWDEAIASYDQAISCQPDNAEAHLSKSMVLLMKGNFAKGWALYEWRWRSHHTQHARRDFTQPLWLGKTPIAGKTILLHCEQGLGDTLQFCRYAKNVSELGARVILEAPKSLLALLQTQEGVSQLVEQGDRLPKYDVHTPLLSLPLAFRTTIDNLPNRTPYLRSNPSKVKAWMKKLGAKTKPRVGLVWSGNPGHRNDALRSLSLSTLTDYLPSAFDYVCLQNSLRATDEGVLKQSNRIAYFGDQLVNFSETAALCDLMDLIITIDTSVAHLSGALGKQTWLILPTLPDWRWMLNRTDSPWYPSMRLYRQEQTGNWKTVLEKIEMDLINIPSTNGMLI